MMPENMIKFSLVVNKSDSLKPKSLLEVAREARSVRTVLEMPFVNFLRKLGRGLAPDTP